MTLTKKEKTMIFVLLIVMLIGGFYVYGISPQKDKLEEKEGKIESLNSQILEAKDTESMFGVTKYNNLKKSIEDIRAQLDTMAAPGVDTTKEVESGNLDKNVEPHRVAIILRQYMAERGINTGESIKISEKIVSGGKISYTYTTEYTCQNYTALEKFIDDVARNNSYYITTMSISEITESNTGIKYIGGTIAITVTYLDI